MLQTFFVVLAVVALTIVGFLAVFTRSSPRRMVEGVVLEKTFQAAHTIGRQPGPNRGGMMPPRQDIQVSDRFLLKLKLDNGIETTAAVPPAEENRYPKGARVRAECEVRGILFWQKVLVWSVEPLQ